MERIPTWLPLAARAITVVGLAGPMLQKFFDYPGQVAFFTRLGIPQPEVMVLLSGLVELAAALGIGLGIAGRLAALALLGNMAVALITAGPNPLSLLVVGGALIVALVGTGPYSLWQPEERLVQGLRG